MEARHRTAWWYLGAKTFQLRRCHANQLHSFFIVGDGACQIGNLDRKKKNNNYFLVIDRDSDSLNEEKQRKRNTRMHNLTRIGSLWYQK